MARETIGPITKAEVEFAVQRLTRIADSVRLLDEWLKAHPECKELWVWRAFSLNDGLRRLESVVPEITRAIQSYSKGTPQGPSSSKKRSTAKPKSPAEVEAIIEDHRKTVKKTKKKT
jgi:hypothetical protein